MVQDPRVSERGPERLRALSLFAGAGGLDIGFHQAGFEIVAAVEIEPAYCETLRANSGVAGFFHHPLDVICEDIRAFDPTPYADMGIRCVIGGPPCQTFSAAGRRSGGVIGTQDQRGKLFQAYCHILEVLEPEVFVFENVYGLPGANGGGPWREITDSFTGLGYTLRAEVLDAADFGVPQHRERLILVGSRGTRSFVFPAPTHGPDSPTGQPLVSVAEAIADLQDPGEKFHSDLGGMYGHLLPLVPPGLNYSFFTAEMGYPEPVFAWRSKFHDLLYKVDPSAPCRTLKAQPGKFTGPFHWKNRHFTSSELKRLQTFPDDYEIVGSYSKVLEQVGNSVPPLMAKVIATSVKEQLLTSAARETYPVRQPGFQSTFRQRQRARNQMFKEIASAAIASRFPHRGAVGRIDPQGRTTAKKQIREERYFISFGGFFRRQVSRERPRPMVGTESFSVRVSGRGTALRLDVRRLGCPRRSLKAALVSIRGLRKYLPSVESLDVYGSVSSIEDMFYVWVAIEDVLVKRSEFFTLIDIYGHYANRGDTVEISTSLAALDAGAMGNAIEFFGQSVNCGGFYGRPELLRNWGVGAREFSDIVSGLRNMRWDVRTGRTHPTIMGDQVLCTYPFPLLSERAHLERKPLVREADRGERGLQLYG